MEITFIGSGYVGLVSSIMMSHLGHSVTCLDIDEVKMLLESLEKMRLLKDNISNQEKELKLRLLVSSRERNVYLEKLRKTEEFGEKNNWKDNADSFFPQLNDLLYKDNASPGLSNVPSGNILEKK